MSTLRILHTNAADTATLTASPASATGYPPSALATRLRSERLRTTSAASQQIRASWATAQTVSAVALCRHNLRGSATWRVRLWSNADYTGGPLHDSGTISAWDASGLTELDSVGDASLRGFQNSALWLSSAVTGVRSATIDWSDSGHPDGWLQAERVFIGRHRALDWNFDWGHPLGIEDGAAQARTLGGSLVAQRNAPPARTLALAFDKLAQADRDFLFDLIRTRGRGADLFVSAWPSHPAPKMVRDYAMWCAIADWNGVEQPIYGYFGTSLTLVEC